MSGPQSETERACLARLCEMDDALELMQKELPDDVQAVGEQARRMVALWKGKLSQGGADLQELTQAMNQVSGLMDALTARLLLVPWEAPPQRGPAS